MSFFFTDYANGLWDETACTHGRVDVLTDTIMISLIDGADWTPDQDTDIDFADVPSAAVIASAQLAGIDVDARKFLSSGATLPSVTGDESEFFIVWKDSGTDATSPLMMMLDDFVAGMPVEPDGTDIEVNPNVLGLARL